MASPILPEPRRPSHMPDFADACLKAVADLGLGEKISLGEGVGLLHYLDYRATHDVDAWWDASAGIDVQRSVVEAIEASLRPCGDVRTRRWGDVVSIDLRRDQRTIFSFQIARRSAQLEPSRPAPGSGVLLDSLRDVVASKMVALVERGAPRDFRDIHALCTADLMTPLTCWQLWLARQELAGSDTDRYRARLAVETHLSRVALHRRLEDIRDPQSRREASEVRTWFMTEFLDALDLA